MIRYNGYEFRSAFGGLAVQVRNPEGLICHAVSRAHAEHIANHPDQVTWLHTIEGQFDNEGEEE